MISHNHCHHPCEYGNCPWIQDPHCDTHWMCLKCGQERDFASHHWLNTILGVLLVFFVIMLLVGCTQPPLQPLEVKSSATNSDPNSEDSPPKTPLLPPRFTDFSPL